MAKRSRSQVAATECTGSQQKIAKMFAGKAAVPDVGKDKVAGEAAVPDVVKEEPRAAPQGSSSTAKTAATGEELIDHILKSILIDNDTDDTNVDELLARDLKQDMVKAEPGVQPIVPKETSVLSELSERAKALKEVRGNGGARRVSTHFARFWPSHSIDVVVLRHRLQKPAAMP